MNNEFLRDTDLKQTLGQLQALVVPKEDNVKSRLKQFVKMDFPSELVGDVFDDGFKVWAYASGKAGTGLFYPILTGKCSESGRKTKISINARMNELGIFVTTGFLILFLYFLTFEIIVQKDNSPEFLLKRLLLGIFLFLLFSSPIYISYWFLRSRIIKYLKQELNLKEV